MSGGRRALVLRPEPGNARTVARLRATGVEAVGVPLFAVQPVPWALPDPDRFDALLLTSANAVRMGGPRLAHLAHLPVVAVGEATAAEARAAGFTVAVTGRDDAASVAAAARAFPRLLHLAGRDHVAVPGAERAIVYASEAESLSPDALAPAIDGVVLLHSARAAALFATFGATLPRARIALAAISAKVAASAGEGWRRVAVADMSSDARLIAAAVTLAIDPADGREDSASHD